MPSKLDKILFLTAIILVGCSSKRQYYRIDNRWTEQQKKDFKCKCEQTKSFRNIVILFRGFENSEFDSVLVRGYENNVLKDQFKFYVFPSESPYDKEHKNRSGTIEQEMYTDYTYYFIIPGQRPYKLSGMSMVMWSEWTEDAEGYGCIMAKFKLDDVNFSGVGNPCIRKRN